MGAAPSSPDPEPPSYAPAASANAKQTVSVGSWLISVLERPPGGIAAAIGETLMLNNGDHVSSSEDHMRCIAFSGRDAILRQLLVRPDGTVPTEIADAPALLTLSLIHI